MPPSTCPVVRCLSFHARYACRDSGACCTSAWPIPVEADVLGRMRAAIARGALRPAAPHGAFVAATEDPSLDAPPTLGVADGACVFFDRGAARHCRIQHALGHETLPLACRQFPRVSVADPGGVSVTLSHYCPTAARLLEQPHAVTIVTGAPAFPPGGEYVGLAAHDGLPPLLRPDMLMDWESWWAIEAHAVELLASGGRSAGDALARLHGAVELIRTWDPSQGALADRVPLAFTAPRDRPVDLDTAKRFREVLEAIPTDWRPAALERRGRPADAVARRFLAAHAFANWTAQLGQGLRSWVRSIDCAWACLEAGLDVREADLLLRHLVDPHRLAEVVSGAETGPPVPGSGSAGFDLSGPRVPGSGSRGSEVAAAAVTNSTVCF